VSDTKAKAVLTEGSQAYLWWKNADDAVKGVNGKKPTWSGIGRVRVLNMYTVDGNGNKTGENQDQLVMLVPLPGAVVLGGAPIAGLFMIRRRPLS
jgi:hypothetical protein